MNDEQFLNERRVSIIKLTLSCLVRRLTYNDRMMCFRKQISRQDLDNKIVKTTKAVLFMKSKIHEKIKHRRALRPVKKTLRMGCQPEIRELYLD